MNPKAKNKKRKPIRLTTEDIKKRASELKDKAGHLTQRAGEGAVHFRQKAGEGAVTLGRNLKESQKKIGREFRKTVPTSGEELGKKIDKKLTSSHKVWQNVGVAIFSQKALENLSHFSSYLLGAIMLLFTDLILIFPTDRRSLQADVLVSNFLLVLVGLIAINLLTYLAMLLMGSKTRFKAYFSTVNTAMFLSLLVVSLPIALLSFAIFATMGSSQSSISLLFTMIPFYNYLVFGWASESLSRLRGLKGILLALISLTLILFLNLILPQFV
ncbi:hypothetical protein KY362_01005 [Candidatus Woesearchaeota archaeon]|nr:hypothetical protein [Candidatus Woesearchaeota archaeon]